MLTLLLLLLLLLQALGGKGNVKIIGCKGKPKEKRDAADGRWLSVCPLVFGDGVLGFLALVMQGNFPQERTEQAQHAEAVAAEAAAGNLDAVDEMTGRGEDQVISSSTVPVGMRSVQSVMEESNDPAIRNVLMGTSKTGYSNELLHNEMFEKGIKQLKEREPWRFPFVRHPLCLHQDALLSGLKRMAVAHRSFT